MFSLTRQEQGLIIFVMLSLIVGSVVKHCRHRLTAPAEHLEKTSPIDLRGGE